MGASDDPSFPEIDAAIGAGDLARAEALLSLALLRAPKELGALARVLNLARALAGAGRAPGAVAVLSAALERAEDFASGWLMLGQIQASVGDFAAAEHAYRRALALAPGDEAACSGLGAVLNDLDRPQEGEAVLRSAAHNAASPWAPRIAHNLGVSLEMQKRYGEALEHFDRAIAGLGDHPLTQHNRAKVLEHLGREEEAIEAYRKSLARDPSNGEAHEQLNALLYRLGRDQEFLASYDDALRRAPGAGALHMNKAGLLMRVGRFEEARESFQRACQLAPNNAAALSGLAAACANLGALPEAISSYEKALRIAPGDSDIVIGFASVLLEIGDAAQALRTMRPLVSVRPHDQSALSVYEVALRAANDGRANWLADYERHVRVFDLAPPQGFSSMLAFNEELNAHLDTLHTDRREHIDQTLRRGTQTNEPLFVGDNALVRLLRLRIEEAVREYIAGLAEEGADHPLKRDGARDFKFAGSWSARLHDSGFHTNHIHPEGWISSCYYVALPDAVSDAEGRQGWIKFGEPSFKTKLETPIQRTVQPAPGKLVLFPSYMWHGTIPFRSAQVRTTVAFDVAPA